MPSETDNQPKWSETLDTTDLALMAEGLPYVLIQALKGPDGDDDLRIRLRAGNGAGDSIGVLPMMALGELGEPHNPLLTLLRKAYTEWATTPHSRSVVAHLAEEMGLDLRGEHRAEA